MSGLSDSAPEAALFGPLDLAAQVMTGAAFPWGFAGGWAIDLFVGHVRRNHTDVDIAILRSDQAALHAHLAGWRWWAVDQDRVLEWHGSRLDAPVHEIRARDPHGAELEFLLNEGDRETWRYRRDLRVATPVGKAFVRHDARPALAPEIVLLFKAKHMRAKDQDDFAAALPLLPADARDWLRSALSVAHPDHAWISALP